MSVCWFKCIPGKAIFIFQECLPHFGLHRDFIFYTLFPKVLIFSVATENVSWALINVLCQLPIATISRCHCGLASSALSVSCWGNPEPSSSLQGNRCFSSLLLLCYTLLPLCVPVTHTYGCTVRASDLGHILTCIHNKGNSASISIMMSVNGTYNTALKQTKQSNSSNNKSLLC